MRLSTTSPVIALGQPLVCFHPSEFTLSVSGSEVPLLRRTARDLFRDGVHYVSFEGVSSSDQLLYVAAKDVFPIRVGSTDKESWRADLTLFSGSPLPSGELSRSIGHRNGPKCVEIFEVWYGRVRMYLQGPLGTAACECVYADLEGGDRLEVPPGYWHSTHVLDGPALVFDIYSGQDFVDLSDKPYYCEEGCYTFVKSGSEIQPVRNGARPCIDCGDLERVDASLVEEFSTYANLAAVYLEAPMYILSAFRSRSLASRPLRVPKLR
jgi:hypothetical protein